MASAADEPKPSTGVTTRDPQSPPSDNDGGERPVRKQLKETTIESTPSKENGRKRSFEESRDGPNDSPSNDDSRRKRSRECTPSNGQSPEPSFGSKDAGAAATSSNDISNAGTNQNTKGLTKKRSREQLEKASPKKSEGLADPTQESDSSKNTSLKSATEDEREKKRHRDNSEERENKTNKLFSTSAFASAAADSPFAKLAGAKSPLSTEASTTENTTPGSAFAGSALGGFAGTEKSPFGTLGASTSSVFKSASPFSAAPSSTGFGGIGGGFGSAAATAKTSFASPNVTSTFGETKAKPLGAEESENDEDENEGEEETNTFEAAKTDERFFEQTIETGEEEEKTIFTCKAKLFSFTTGEWKERGIGTFKVNARDVDGKKVGRMIMRADGALRVMLNSPVFEGMNYGDAKNKAPTSKQIFLASTEEGRTVPLLLRTPNESHALELYRTIRKLLTGENEDESDDEEE